MAPVDVKQHVYLLTGRIISWVEVLPYVHRNRSLIRDRTSTSTFTQLLSSVRIISNQSMDRTKGLLGARELCESRDGRPWPPAVPNSPYGPCGRKATLEEEEELKASELRSCVKGEVVVLKSVNMVLNVHRNHQAYQGRGYGGGRGKVDYIPIANTVTTRMTPALRWAAMRAVSMFH